jgi:hypothetical protein
MALAGPSHPRQIEVLALAGIGLRSRLWSLQGWRRNLHGQTLRLAGEGQALPWSPHGIDPLLEEALRPPRKTRTRAEVMDSVSRRWASGEASHPARVSSKQVLLIRKLYPRGNVTQSTLAERFGISISSVKRILARRSWKHI